MRCWRMSASLRVFWLERAQTIRWPSAEQIGAGAVCHVSSGSSVRSRPPQRLGPVGLVGVRPVAQEAVLAAAAWKDGHEPSAVGVDVGHLLARAQLAVGDIEEVRATDDRAQLVPGGDVRLVIARVAVAQAVRDRDRLVGADGQDPRQLLEIGTVVLVVAVRRRGGRLARARMPSAQR